jgi:hypothetical protein
VTQHMVTKIEGVIKPGGGQGFARENYKVIIPEIAKEFPAVQNCGKHGTINVDSLKPPLRKSFADYWTFGIEWEPVAGKATIGSVRHEKYGLIKIQFEYPLGGDRYDAWAIMPEGHGWSYDENGGVEIIAEPKICDLQRDTACAIYIDHKPQKPRPNDFRYLKIDGVLVDAGPLQENPGAVPR